MRLLPLSVPLIVLAVAAPSRADESSKNDAPSVQVTIDATKTGPPINPFIYGQFIEHLGRCIYGGIWAEMLEDRKFYFPITDEYRPYGERTRIRFPVVGASPWQVVGPAGSVTMTKEKPFVGEHTPLVAAGSGFQQNDLAFVEGKKYVGHIRVRAAKGKSRVTVSLATGEAKADRPSWIISAEGDDYERFPLSFTAEKTTHHGSIVIEVAGGPCLIGAVSFMPADNVRGFRADTLELLKQLNAPMYRWPGGNFVSGYDWRDGIGPRDRRPPRKNPAWTGVEHNDVGLDEFLDLCNEIGTEPVIAVNTGFGDDYSAAQQVEYVNGSKETIGGIWRVANGHEKPYGVKYWCIGNEMWGPWQLGFMEFNQYALKHNRFAAAMHKADPKLVFIGCGDLNTKVSLTNGNRKRDTNWSEGMLVRCADTMNYISEHFYKGKTPWGDKPPEELPKYVALLKDEIRKKSSSHRELQAKLGRKPDKFIPIAMDEWNYWHNNYVYGELGCPYSLADALGVAAGLHEYFRNSDIIHMANYAQTVNVIGCIKTTKTAAFFDTTALPLMLYRREFGTLPLAVNGNHGERAIDIVAAKTQDDSAVTIGVINPQAKSQTIDMTIVGVKLGSTATVWRIAAGDPAAGNTVEKQSVAIAEEKDVPFGEQLTVPAYSASVYRVPVK